MASQAELRFDAIEKEHEAIRLVHGFVSIRLQNIPCFYLRVVGKPMTADGSLDTLYQDKVSYIKLSNPIICISFHFALMQNEMLPCVVIAHTR